MEKKHSLEHIPRMLKSSLKNGGSGFHRRVMWVNLYSSHLLILISGVGNLRPNAREGDEDEIPKGPADEKWIRLLNEDDGVYTLKSWEEVVELKGNKHDVSHAFREVMRQAWSE